MTVAEHPILDLTILDQYCELIGASILFKSVALFETQASDYISNITEAFSQGNQEVIVNEAHKLKGAASSIGLKRIQQLAESLQRNDHEDWQTQHPNWFDSIKSNLVEDTEQLKSHLLQQM